MKVIDLLNKIANGEITKITKIIINGELYTKNIESEKIGEFESFCCQRKNGITLSTLGSLLNIDNLNDEVEIIEEEKKIPKKLKCKYTSQIGKIELAKTINEIIDYLESKGD
jgi:hypothetical protein